MLQEFFKKKYLLKFQEVLLICLITKSYDLLSENIISLLFHMISVDFELFYRSFLVNFIEQQLCDLKVDQRNLLRQIFKEDEVCYSFSTLNNFHIYFFFLNLIKQKLNNRIFFFSWYHLLLVFFFLNFHLNIRTKNIILCNKMINVFSLT